MSDYALDDIDSDRGRRARALAIIRDTHRDPELCAEVLARRLHISVRQLYRSFEGEESPSMAITRARVTTALFLFAQTDLTAQVVATRAGFSSPGTMRRQLRRYTGVGPRRARVAFAFSAAG